MINSRALLQVLLVAALGFPLVPALGRSVAADIVSTATCIDGVGPGMAPPQVPLTTGIPGFHAAWYGQSGYQTVCPGRRSTATVAFLNTGSRGWVPGRSGHDAYLGTWGPEPGQDQASALGGDGTLGSPDSGWPRYNRISQPAGYVGPGQIGWFQFTIQAPLTPGTYRLSIRELVEGAVWMEDYGVFWYVSVPGDPAVLIPPPSAPPGPAPTAAPTPAAGVPPPPSSDATRPTIVSVGASPRTVDAGTSVTVTARVTDAQSGVAGVTIRYSYPQPGTDVLAFTAIHPLTLVSGTSSDGTWQTTFAIPLESISGAWLVDNMSAFDGAANLLVESFHSNPLFVDAGFAVAARSDQTPPSIVSLVVSPRTVPPGGAVTVSARLIDADPGVVSASICYRQPNGQPGLGFCPGLGLSTTTGGSPRDGVWTITFAVPAGSATGTWTVSSLVATDAAGNRTTLLPPTPPSGDGAFTVTASSDTTAPSIASLSVSPATVIAGGAVVVTARITDADSGVAWSGICYDLPGGAPAPVGCPNLVLAAGTAQDGLWRVNITVPAGSAPGTWTVRAIAAGDAAGNRVDVAGPAAPTADGSFTVR